MAQVDIVGTCERLDDPQAPVWSRVHLTNVEAVGAGTLAWNPDAAEISPHIHVSVGLKQQSATGYTSHLLSATVQFVVEMVIVEVLSPVMERPRNPALYDVPQLRFA
jgi:predicted DNA-binding protein with PD1-like motif